MKKNTLVSRFVDSVNATPNAKALKFGDREVTYKKLDCNSNRIASLLQKKNIGPDSPVAILMDRSIEMMTIIYGIEKAGGCYVPLDTNSPIARINYIIKDVGAKCLITDQMIHIKGIETIHTKELLREIEDEPVNPIDRSEENSMAYIIYTSGSTGNPKGVAVEHRSIVNRLDWMQKQYPLTREDVLIQKTPYTFDVSVWELFWGLQRGSKLFITKPGGHKDNEYLASVIEEENVTVIHFVPCMLNAFFETDLVGCRGLKYIFCSGEELTGKIVSKFFKMFDETTSLINLYGPTEAAVDVTYWNCTKMDIDKKIPIGYPIDNTQIYIVDENNVRVPNGIMGEIVISGIQLARGYINRDELTKDRFRNIFIDGVGEVRVYKTGDLGTMCQEGYVHYYGRMDQQVKIRGLRVELGEIESNIKEMANVNEAVVVAQERDNGEKMLVAYVESQSKREIEDIKKLLREKLPEYMIPVKFIFIEKMPHLQNGKIDRKKLSETSIKQDIEVLFEQKLNDDEKIVMKIIREELNDVKIPKDEELFSYGLDSIKVIRIVSKLRKEGFQISGEKIYNEATISAIARNIVRGNKKVEKKKKFALLDDIEI